MPAASHAQTDFSGGEWSKTVQGRFDDPKYRSAMSVCLNGLPLETGAWTRRPGTRHAGTTRGGLQGRVLRFDFQQNAPYGLEFTDTHLRFRSGASLVTTNDSVTIVSISTANPAVVELSEAVDWATSDHGFFSGLGTTSPLLHNRVFALTKVDTTHFSLADAVTADAIDGSTLAWTATSGATINRILDLVTTFPASVLSNLRVVQAETTAFILNATRAPYALTVDSLPTSTDYATFELNPATFNDGPYLDPFTNGVRAVPTATSGIISITLQFPAYDSSTAYAAGAFVTYSSVNYRSKVDQNVGNTPNTSPTQWEAVSGATAISANGFQGTDVGRLVRFYSEPDLWASGITYSAGAIVSYNPSGLPGQTTYWSSVSGSNTGNVPGKDATHWSLLSNSAAALWTWGRITALANGIDHALAGSTNFGDMTASGGNDAAFDGNVNQSYAAGAAASLSVNFISRSAACYVGKNYSGASAQLIASATVYPSSDLGFCHPTLGYPNQYSVDTITFNIRAKHTAPASRTDGTIIGTATVIGSQITAPVTVTSTDQATAWEYVWIDVTVTTKDWSTGGVNFANVGIAEVTFFNPATSSTSANGVNVEILGPALLYTSAIRTWRLGLYSDTTGWPTCGTYGDGRIWLSGAVNNRIDACVANGITGGTVNFAPTDQNGVVSAASAIAYTFNAPDTNPIFWMTPDLQGYICGTKAGEWVVQAPSSGAISPLNIAARRVTHIGCANIEPRRTEHTTVFVQKFGRKVMEYFADVFSGKFTAPHITYWSKHLTKGDVAEIAYQQELAPIVWARRSDGALVGWTYKRDTLMTSQGPTIAAGHRHTLGSGRTVESITTGPSVGGNLDALTMVTNDTDTNIRHVEVLTDIFEEGGTLADGWFLDNAITPSAYVADGTAQTVTLYGLWHLNGETASVVINGLDAGDYTISNGSCTVPLDGTKNVQLQIPDVTFPLTVVVGLPYTSQGQPVRLAEQKDSGAGNGPAFGKTARAHMFAALMIDTIGGTRIDGTPQGIEFGTDLDDTKPALFKHANRSPYLLDEMFNGVHRTTLKADYSFDSAPLGWQITRPAPATIAAISTYQHTQDQ